MVGQGPVDLSKDPRNIFMDMNEPMGISLGRQLEIGEVHTAKAGTGIEVLNDSAGNIVRDIVLGLLRTSSNMGGQNDIFQTLKLRDELFWLLLGSVGYTSMAAPRR